MKTSRGMAVIGLLLGLLGWGSCASMHATVGAWCYLPAVLFGALAAFFLAGAAGAAGRPGRLVTAYAFPALAVCVLVTMPVEVAYWLHREHGASLAVDLLQLAFSFTLLCWRAPSILRRGRPHEPTALAEVAAAETEEPEGDQRCGEGRHDQ